MTIKTFILSLLTIVSIASCKNNSAIVNAGDYNQYLQSTTSKKIQEIDTELNFWKSKTDAYKEDMAAQAKTAGLLTKRFSFSGNINEVHKADSIYRELNKINRKSTSSTFRSLAANDITQHKFKEAGLFIDSALLIGDNKYLSVLMEVDIAMELGDMLRAKTVLSAIKDKHDFGYLVRKAKMLDHDGKGEEAIDILKEALKNINPETEKVSYLWAKTNLGDWLGHNNHFRESYQSYLDALKVEPENYHALKGIAWLAFAHDKNSAEAKRILSYLMKVHPVPDYKLLMSEIAAYEKNDVERTKWENEFIADVSNPMYGDMYNKYLFEIYAESKADYSKAFAIAKKEVDNRPTPLSYDMVAWAYYKMGKIEDAAKITKMFVENKCFEPFSTRHQGMIFKAVGEKKKAEKYLEQAYESSFELGPVAAKSVQQALYVL